MTVPRAIAAGLVATVSLGSGRVALAQEGAITVTTDSPAFCMTLDHLLAAGDAPRSDEVLRLTREGDEMCASGEVRGGITRLRRALLIWREGEGRGADSGGGRGGGPGGGGPGGGGGPRGGPR